ncbi:cysteine--tRNA ligase, partial [Candidatus Dependentiae bacterium]|nr:cysteine--tRNA ligase [Candidatus Dependentiae bacterium]
MEIKLTNTLSRKKEVFKPLKNKTVKLYVCGVTPYDYSHIGHGRCYVNFDVL